MRNFRLGMFGVSALALAACITPPGGVTPRTDATRAAHWRAALSAPSDVLGAVPIHGSATMSPGPTRDSTSVTLQLTNATPGGVHGWAVHRGRCGADQGLLGAGEAYQPVTIDRNGRASASATLALETPQSGNYFVSVRDSSASSGTSVACGNLTHPGR